MLGFMIFLIQDGGNGKYMYTTTGAGVSSQLEIDDLKQRLADAEGDTKVWTSIEIHFV